LRALRPAYFWLDSLTGRGNRRPEINADPRRLEMDFGPLKGIREGAVQILNINMNAVFVDATPRIASYFP
jgi:hypothetical protein